MKQVKQLHPVSVWSWSFCCFSFGVHALLNLTQPDREYSEIGKPHTWPSKPPFTMQALFSEQRMDPRTMRTYMQRPVCTAGRLGSGTEIRSVNVPCCCKIENNGIAYGEDGYDVREVHHPFRGPAGPV